MSSTSPTMSAMPAPMMQLPGLCFQEDGQLSVSWFSEFDRNYCRGCGEVVINGRLAVKLSGWLVLGIGVHNGLSVVVQDYRSPVADSYAVAWEVCIQELDRRPWSNCSAATATKPGCPEFGDRLARP